MRVQVARPPWRRWLFGEELWLPAGMRSVALAVLLVVFCGVAAADVDPKAAIPADAPRHLVVGTVPVAPFIIKNADGTWSGISMDLWKEVAHRLDLTYEVRELVAADLDDAAKMAALDVFVSLNVTAKREAQLDLTHAFFSTGLAIAVAPKVDTGLLTTLKQIFTAKFAKLVAALMAVLLFIGVLMWLAERRRNDQFAGPVSQGIGAGLWWSAVTMTTVGYGDKSPVTFAGRVLGLVWMFAALIIISSFTASIAAALTVNQLATGVTGPNDLPKAKVATVSPSQGERYLQARHIAYKGYKDAATAVDALAKGEVEAVVYEAPILQYQIKNRSGGADLSVLDGTFDNHGYALALRQGSALREAVNLALLQFTATDDWTALLAKYL
jgi:polar amino acid transport system substrate-binding protein